MLQFSNLPLEEDEEHSEAGKRGNSQPQCIVSAGQEGVITCSAARLGSGVVAGGSGGQALQVISGE